MKRDRENSERLRRFGRLTEESDAQTGAPDDLLELEQALRGFETAPLTDAESDRLMTGLNDRIDGLSHQAHGWNRFGVRYGISLAALVLLIGVSMISLGPVEEYTADTYYLTQVYYDDMDSISTEIISSEYFDDIVDAYLWQNDLGTVDELVGELTADEYEYLKNNLQVGDIL